MQEEGSIHLTGIKLLAPHLTDENHRKVLESARGKSKLAIAEIVARLHPLPDVPTSLVPILEFGVVAPPATTSPHDRAFPSEPRPPVVPSATPPIVPPAPPVQPTTLTPLSPRRYKLQLTISGETLEKLRRAKDMLGHVVAAGDDDAVLNRALTVLLDKLAREKLARSGASSGARRGPLPVRLAGRPLVRGKAAHRGTPPGTMGAGKRCRCTRGLRTSVFTKQRL